MNFEKRLLSDIADVSAGQGAPQQQADYVDDGIPFVKAGNLLGLSLGMPECNIQKVSPKTISAYKLKLFAKGTILFAKSGMSCKKGVIYQLSNDACVVNHLACVMPKNINGIYLKYFFIAYPPNILIRDESYPSIRLSDIENIQVVYPADEIQQQIANVLENTTTLISKRKEQIALLDKLAKDVFIDMFGDLATNSKQWKIKNILDIATFDTRMTTDFDKYADMYHIGIENIEKGSGKIVQPIKIKDSGLISGKYQFDERHIIYSKIRPNLNKVALPTFSGLCSADSYPILTKTEICERTYLAYVLRSDFFLDYILSFSSRTNIPKVNKKQIAGFSLPVPDYCLQEQFADKLHIIDAQKSRLQTSLAELEITYKSILQKAFNGELFS